MTDDFGLRLAAQSATAWVATLCRPGATSGATPPVDGLIGGATGLLVVGLFPRNVSGSTVLATDTRDHGVSS